MGSSRKIATGVAWTVILNVVNGVYGFISVPLLIAYFGKSDYGLIGLAMSVNVYLRLMDLGFNSTNVRYFSNWLEKKDFHKVKRLFQTSLTFYGTIGLVNSLILLVVAFFSGSIFNVTPEQDIIVKHLFYILSISAFVSWFTSCFDQFISANEEVGWVKRLSLLPKILQIVVLLLTITIKFNIEWYYALTAFSLFVTIPFMVVKIKKLCPFISFIPFFDKAIFKEVLPYSLNIFSFSLFQFSITHLRPVLLGIESTPSSIAEYNVINGIIQAVLLLGGAFLGVILPSASKVVANDNRNAQDMIAYKGTKYISMTLCFCCFGMMSIVPELITAYVGTDYLHLTIWLDLGLLSTLCSHNQAISSLILAGADVRAITYSSLVAAIISLALCWFLIPVFDVGGTIIAYFAYCFIQIMFYYIYYWPKVMKINSTKVFLSSFLPFVIVGGIICTFLRFVSISGLSNWVLLIMKGGLFFIAFILTTFILMDNEDKQFIKRFIQKA